MSASEIEPEVAGMTTGAQWLARIALVIVLAVFGLWTIRGFLPSIAWAVILAIALWPLYRRAQLRFPPNKADIVLPALFTLAVLVVFVAPLLFAAVQVGREGHDLLEWYKKAETSGIPAPDWIAKLSIGGWNAADWWKENLSSPPALADMLKRLDRATFVSYTREFGLQLVHRTIVFAFTLLTLFFVFRDGPYLSAQLLKASHRVFGPSGERVGRQMVASVHGTVDGLVLVGLGEGVLLGISYVFAGLPHPALMGALTAIAAVIPFGAPVIFCIAGLILIAQGSIAAAVAVVVFGFLVVLVADHFIRPVLIGAATRLPFVWVLFGILGGVETWGLLGLFLGPALMAALMLLWRELTEEPRRPPPGRT
jgi:predicted PurR-regulated permease PerM